MAIKLDARVEVRMSKSEKRDCEIKAKQAGMDLSSWIRRRLLLTGTGQAPSPPNTNTQTASS
jgi:hypothetical protein